MIPAATATMRMPTVAMASPMSSCWLGVVGMAGDGGLDMSMDFDVRTSVVSSIRNQSAIHVVRLSRDVVGIGTGQKHGHPGDVFRRFGPPHGDIASAVLPYRTGRPLFEFAPLAVDLLPHVGIDRSGTDAVYRQFRCKLHCGGLRNVDSRRLAGGIGAQHGTPSPPGYRSDVYDLAAGTALLWRRLPEHLACTRLQREK